MPTDEPQKSHNGRITYAYSASIFLTIGACLIYLRWIYPAETVSFYGEQEISNASRTVLLLPLISAALLIGALAKHGVDGEEPTQQRMIGATIAALIPFMLIVWAANTVNEYNYKDVITDRFVRYTRGIDETHIGKPNRFYGSGSQMLVCAPEYDSAKSSNWIGELCVVVDGNKPSYYKSVEGGFRLDGESPVPYDCFGIERGRC